MRMKTVTRICKHCNTLFSKTSKKRLKQSNGIRGFICDECKRKYKNNNNRIRLYEQQIQQPMTDNHLCSAYLGCYRAENFVFSYYNISDIMPYGFHGYDCICNNKYKLEIKSSTVYHRTPNGYNWQFAIRKNKIADYFILVAYDDNDSLSKPSHMWEIPANLVNMKTCLSISCNPRKRTAFDMYEKMIT